MSKLQYILFTFLLFAWGSGAIEKKDLPKGSQIILQSLNDELKRNLDSLSYEDYSRPYYISYALNDVKSIQIVAGLGALTNSQSDHTRGNSVRLMVGDYDVNDENFIDRSNPSTHNDGYLSLPLEDDYLGIRRSFWLMTNNVYKNAAELFKNKQQAMKNKGLQPEDLKVPDFSKEKANTSYEMPIRKKVDVEHLENMAKDISSVFSEYPQVTQSSVYFIHQNSTDYVVNSEGTEIVKPSEIYRIAIVAMAYSQENDPIGDFLTYYGSTLEELPPVENIKADIRKLNEFLTMQSEVEPFIDSYTGPVLLSRNAVPEILFQKLFIKGNGLLAQRLPLINDKIKGLYNPRRQTWENRFGNKVIDKNYSVYNLPKAKTFNGLPLKGGYAIDMEGVVPSDTVVLIENGLLKSQLIDRTPTSKQLHSTGSSRLFLDVGGTTSILSPANIWVKAKKTSAEQELKNQLIAEAKENSLQYAVIIKPLATHSNYAPLVYYKVDVETGEEKMLRAVSSEKISSKSLTNIISSSEETFLYHTLFNGSRLKSHGQPVLTGAPVSYITPRGVLLRDAVILGINEPIKRDGTIVDNPVN